MVNHIVTKINSDFSRKLSIFCLVFSAFIVKGVAQPYQDYIGAGHHQGITVRASSAINGSIPENTLNGSGLDSRIMEASRFLFQAGYGGNLSEIRAVSDMGFEAWIEDQFTKTSLPMTERLPQIMNQIYAARLAAGLSNEDYYGPWAVHFHYAYWTTIMTEEDVLRHKIAQALSELLVVSINSDIRDWGPGLSSYYDMLGTHAFGNYRDLLLDVVYHPIMAYYLTHYNNPRSDESANVRPDENFAREIMQLFTIGLYELNQDGSQKLDANGNPIPTYDNLDIKEFAKVFTGLSAARIEPWAEEYFPNGPYFGTGIWAADKTAPLAMYDDFHEPGEKYLLNGFVIPSGQSGEQDIAMAVDHLFRHPNVGPFLAKRLIQRLIKSNPSPDYISRVAAAFSDNGSGVRGDLKAMIKAILLDPEARAGEAMLAADQGMLRPPMNRVIQLVKSLPLENNRNRFWNNGFTVLNSTGHHIFGAPSVFNFYLPDHQPVGPLSQVGLASPEMKIHNTSTGPQYFNLMHDMIFWNFAWYSWEGEEVDESVRFDLTELEAIAHDSELLINTLDKILTHGMLTDDTRSSIRTAIEKLNWPWNEDWRDDRVRMALHLIMISPDYVIQK